MENASLQTLCYAMFNAIILAPRLFTNLAVLSGSLQIRFTGFTGTHLHGETSGSHSIYMGRWLILGTLWNLHGEIGVLHAIYMGRLYLDFYGTHGFLSMGLRKPRSGVS